MDYALIANKLSKNEMDRKAREEENRKNLVSMRGDLSTISKNIAEFYHIKRGIIHQTGDMLTVLTNKQSKLEQYRIVWSINQEELPLVIQRLVQAKESGTILQDQLFTEDKRLLEIAIEFLEIKGLE